MCRQDISARLLKTVTGVQLENKDFDGRRAEWLVSPPAAFRPALRDLLEDPRDEPCLYLVLNVLFLVLPSAALLFALEPSHRLGAGYFILTYVFFLQRFMLTLHFTEHRRLFKKEYNLLNYITPFVLCPLFGVPSGMYRLHHCIVHHTEGNGFPGDVSSTEPYQRDNFLHFLVYWMRYLWLAAFELPVYAARHGRPGLAAQSAVCIGGYAVLLRTLRAANPVAATWVVVVPFFFSSFALMLGNWSQHAFINPDRPRSAFGMTYSCLNHRDNQTTYNDGYHIQHHADSRLHWTLLPQRFMDTLEQHAAEDALVFHGVHFFEVGLAAFTGRLGWLADHYCQVGQPQRTRGELIQELKRRLRPITRAEREGGSSALGTASRKGESAAAAVAGTEGGRVTGNGEVASEAAAARAAAAAVTKRRQ